MWTRPEKMNEWEERGVRAPELEWKSGRENKRSVGVWDKEDDSKRESVCETECKWIREGERRCVRVWEYDCEWEVKRESLRGREDEMCVRGRVTEWFRTVHCNIYSLFLTWWAGGKSVLVVQPVPVETEDIKYYLGFTAVKCLRTQSTQIILKKIYMIEGISLQQLWSCLCFAAELVHLQRRCY